MKLNNVFTLFHRTTGSLARSVVTPFRIPILRYRERGKPGIRFVTDNAQWSILRDGEGIIGHLNQTRPGLSAEIVSPRADLFHKVVHFGCQWGFFNNIEKIDPSNRTVVTVFHWNEAAEKANREAIEVLRRNIARVDAIVTACAIMEERLLSWNVPARKLHRIPIGADLGVYRQARDNERVELRRRFGIPDDAVCIGSFQKDGVGWGEGLEPKLIKGPDILVEVVSRLSVRHPVFVLLAGPARGYVRGQLDNKGIPYHHEMVEHPNELAPFYQALDFYLVSSREEGGPKALPEAMASGTPLVSTRVGMAPDMIVDGENGLLADIDDVETLAAQAERLIKDPAFRKRLVENGLKAVENYDVAALAERHMQEVYKPLLDLVK